MPDTRPVEVLLVEDDAADAALIRAWLSRSATLALALTRHACLGDALADAAGRRFDVVLLDLTLPDASGIDAIARVLERLPGVSLVVLTGRDEPVLAALARRSGAQDYLVKGRVREGDVLAAIYSALRQRLLREAHAQAEETQSILCELRGMLTVALVTVRALQQGLAGSLTGKQQEYLSLAQQSLQRIKALVAGPTEPPRTRWPPATWN